jgi:protease-4
MKTIPDNIMSLIGSPLQIYQPALNGIIAEVFSRHKSGEKAPQATVAFVPVDGQKGKTVMIIPVMKIISKQDIEDYGVLGTESIQKLVVLANQDPNCLGVVLHVNNPGGTVINTTETARDIRASGKPKVAFIEQLGASSGYYLAAACDYIFSSGPTTMVGNIGTKSSGLDLTGILEKLGAKSWEIYAKESFDKDLGFVEAMAGKPGKFQDAILAPYSNLFMGDMKGFRPQIKEEALHGMIYIGQDSIDMGLVDAFGNMINAIAKVVELSSNNSNTNTNPKNNMKKVFMSVPETAVAAVKILGGVEETAAPDAKVTALEAEKTALTNEKTQAEAKVTALEAEKTALTNEKTQAEAKVTALEAEKTALTNEKNQAQAEITALKAKISTTAGANPTAGKKEGEQGEPTQTTVTGDDLALKATEDKIAKITASFGL